MQPILKFCSACAIFLLIVSVSYGQRASTKTTDTTVTKTKMAQAIDNAGNYTDMATDVKDKLKTSFPQSRETLFIL